MTLRFSDKLAGNRAARRRNCLFVLTLSAPVVPSTTSDCWVAVRFANRHPPKELTWPERVVAYSVAPSVMATLRAEYEFEVEGFWVFEEVGGLSIEFERDGKQMAISLPQYDEGADSEDRVYGSGSETIPKGTARPLRRFTVAVTAEGPIGAADFKTSTNTVEQAHAFKLKQYELARQVAAEFIDDVRVRRNQPWLSPHPPRLVATSLVDLEAGKKLPVGWAPPLTVWVGAAETAVDQELFEGPIRTVLASAAYPDVPAILLADARHHAIRADIRHEAAIALLLAAVALEVKVKQTLRRKTTPARLPLLDVVVDNPRDVTVAAANLADRVARAAVGRSLRDDDPSLFRRVDLLFQRRNAFAHRGEYPTEADARDATNAAIAAFQWLESL